VRKLFKGPVQPYLEGAFIAELLDLERHPLDEVTVVVPTRLVGGRLLRKTADEAGSAAGLRFVTLDGLIEGPAYSALAARSLKPLPSRAALILLERAAGEVLSRESRLGALLGFGGMPAALWNTIRDLKEARITPEMLADAAEGMRDSAKVREISRVWRAYEKAKSDSGFCDDKDLQYIVLEELESEPPRLDTPLFIYGIYDATHLQLELLRSYIGKNDALAFVPWYARKPADEFTRPFIDFLTGNGFEEMENAVSGTGDDTLTRFRGRLFNMEAATEEISDDGRVRLFTAADPYHEARETVRHLLERCRERGVPFDEAGIILRNGHEYGPLFMEVLNDAGVPYRYAVNHPLTLTPGGRALSRLARLIHPNMRDQERVAEFLEVSPLINPVDGTAIPASSWTRIAREAKVVNWMEGYRNRLNSHIEYLEEELKRGKSAETVKQDAEQAKALREFMGSFLSELDKIPFRAPWKTIVERFEKIYASYMDKSAPGVSESLALLGRFFDMSDALRESSVDEFIHALEQEAGEENVTPANNAAHGIVVAEVMQVRGAVFGAAAIPGVSKGRFPAPFREDPLLLDDERKKLAGLLKNQGAYPPDLKERRLLEEKFLFLIATGSASEELAVSYPRGGGAENNRSAYPSGFFIEALEALKGAAVRIEDELEKLKARPLSPVHVPEKLERAITEEEAVRWLARHHPEGLPEFPFLEAGKKAVAGHAERILTPYDAVIGNKELKKNIREAIESGRIRLSPGKLEKYARCPFSFFLQNILRVGPAEEPEEVDEMTALDLGGLYHRVLQCFYRRLRDEKLLPLDEKNLQRYHEILEQEAERLFRAEEEMGTMVGKKLVWSHHKENIMEDAKALLDKDIRDKEWTPRFFEVPIGGGKYEKDYETELAAKKPVSVKFGEDTQLFLTGRIDRIDISRDGKSARVIDYKGGSNNGYSNDNLKGGEQIQVALYMRMAEKLLEESGKEMKEGAYYFINRLKNKGKIEIRSVGEALNDLDETVSLIVNCIKSGLFHQYPDKKGKNSCEVDCEFARACIYKAEYMRRLKHKDTALAPWNRLKEIKRK